MASIETAMERMYGDIGLTDELTDDEAEVLLAWGAAEHEKLNTDTMDEEAFEARAQLIRRTMSRINNYIGKRGGYDADKAHSVMARLTEGLHELGYEVRAAQVDTFLAAQGEQDNMTALQSMLALIAPSADAESCTVDNAAADNPNRPHQRDRDSRR
jgi:hypothetical protein